MEAIDKIKEINLQCYSLCIYCHCLALLPLCLSRDHVLTSLIVLYIINDVSYHLNMTNRLFNIWHFFIIIGLALYLIKKIINLPTKNSQKRGLMILGFYLLVELLVWWQQTRDREHRLCYEALVHITIWISLFILLWCEPTIRVP